MISMIRRQRPDTGLPEVSTDTWWDRLWRPFWALPAAVALTALFAGLLLPLADSSLAAHLPYVFQGGPDGARNLLGTIATAMISVTGLVFSLTMVVLQLASSQFTPRILGDFLERRITQVTLGVFVASFVFALETLRSVRGSSQGEVSFVPQLSVTLAFILVLASMGCFLAFIHDITTSIQVSAVISRIGDTSVDLVDRLHPQDQPDEASPWTPQPGAPLTKVEAETHGTLTQIAYRTLVELAQEVDAVVTLELPIGAFVMEGDVLGSIWGADEVPDHVERRMRNAIRLGRERVMSQEVGFGLRQLVDIAERALSPGINDPTTAVQCLHQIRRILRPIVQRPGPSSQILDDEQHVRVIPSTSARGRADRLGARGDRALRTGLTPGAPRSTRAPGPADPRGRPGSPSRHQRCAREQRVTPAMTLNRACQDTISDVPIR